MPVTSCLARLKAANPVQVAGLLAGATFFITDQAPSTTWVEVRGVGRQLDDGQPVGGGRR